MNIHQFPALLVKLWTKETRENPNGLWGIPRVGNSEIVVSVAKIYYDAFLSFIGLLTIVQSKKEFYVRFYLLSTLYNFF